MVTFRPSADVVEMTVIVGIGPRTRALAVRLERDRPTRRASRTRPAAPLALHSRRGGLRAADAGLAAPVPGSAAAAGQPTRA